MDHIPYTGSTRIGVPYLEGDDFDGGEFFDYPNRWNARFNIGDVISMRGRTVDLILGKLNFVTGDSFLLTRCLQQWLFVGLYSIVMELAGIEFNVQDFKDYKGRPAGDPRLSTKKLPEYFARFGSSLAEKIAKDGSLEDQLNLIFHHAVEMLRGHCTHLYNQSLHDTDDTGSQEEVQFLIFPVTLSIQHCIQALMTVCQVTYSLVKPGKRAKFSALRCAVPEIDNQFNQFMIKFGWCPSIVSKIRTWDINSDFRYAVFTHWREIMRKDEKQARIDRLMKLFGMEKKPMDHSQCSGNGCLLSQNDENDYEVRHLGYECYCQDISPPHGAIESVLRNGGIPVCRLVSDSSSQASWRLEVQEAAPDYPYAAISHVWAQGMGNPKENAVPECQLIRIQELVNIGSNQASLGTWGEDNKPLASQNPGDNKWFWMDTLCIPVSPKEKKLRKQAIRCMRQIYQEAEFTLVIDTTLLATPLAGELLNSLEPAAFLVFAQVFSSPWSSRLWTLQESTLAKHVYIIFSSPDPNESLSVLDLDDLFRLLQVGLERQRAEHGSLAANQACIFMNTLRRRQGTSKSELRSILGALGYRSTSRRSDETICITTLLDLDVGRLLEIGDDTMDDDAVADARMVQFLRSLPEIPTNILFSPTPRLSIKNFSWAPRSFLGFGFSVQQMKTGMLTPSGLELTMNGIFISDGNLDIREDTVLAHNDRLVDADSPINGAMIVKEAASADASEGVDFLRGYKKALILGIEDNAEISSAAIFVNMSADHPVDGRLMVDFVDVSRVEDGRWQERKASGTLDFLQFSGRINGPVSVGYVVREVKWCLR